MKKGDWVKVPRFCSVKIEAVLTREEAGDQGYTEPTNYEGEYEIFGKSIGENRMTFAAVIK